MQATSSEYLEVRSSGIHNKGCFAAKDIPAGTHIIEYVGEIINKDESDTRADERLEAGKNDDKNEGRVYIFTLDKKHDIDGNVEWNTARLINHSCSPNCEAVDHKGGIWISAMRDIKKGEELSYDYGYDIDSYEDHPCYCGSSNCIGYIVARHHWRALKKKLAKKKRKLKK